MCHKQTSVSPLSVRMKYTGNFFRKVKRLRLSMLFESTHGFRFYRTDKRSLSVPPWCWRLVEQRGQFIACLYRRFSFFNDLKILCIPGVRHPLYHKGTVDREEKGRGCIGIFILFQRVSGWHGQTPFVHAVWIHARIGALSHGQTGFVRATLRMKTWLVLVKQRGQFIACLYGRFSFFSMI